jgi:hypothetical protein
MIGLTSVDEARSRRLSSVSLVGIKMQSKDLSKTPEESAFIKFPLKLSSAIQGKFIGIALAK